MAIKYRSRGKETYYVKGATERVIDKCPLVYSNGKSIAFTKEKRDKILEAYNLLAGSALRVLAFAYGEDLKNLTFVGLMGIMDPPRKGVKSAIQKANESGVKVVMITGDSKETAVAIAKELNIFKKGDIALSGEEVENSSAAELAERVDTVSIFYRVSPEHKMKIVNAFSSRGHIVAMTGDGVNDAPALKVADIGVSMGQGGTDVAKEASEMILVDDNFTTIVAAIEEGKSIYRNIKNFLRFELTTSAAALTIISFSTLLRLPLPLNPIQILWINIIMDGPPAQSLGVEPLDEDVMKNPPRDPNEPVITRKMVSKISSAALIMVIGTLGIFFWELNNGSGHLERSMTLAFTGFVMFQMFNALNCRSEDKSIFHIGFFSNKWVLIAIAGSILMQLGVIYVPFLQFIFDTVALSLKDLVYVTLVASSVFIFDEVWKLVK